MSQTPPAPPTKYPPLTPAQQRQVLAYRKIATDYARRLVISYARLIDKDDAESIAMVALCQAVQRFDPARASGVWALAKLRIRQRIFEEVHVVMTRSACSAPVTELDKAETPTASAEDRKALLMIIEWASKDPSRAETIDRAAVGDDLTPADLDRLEELRTVLELPAAVAVDVATAAQRLGCTPKALRSDLARGTVPGFRCGATWRVYLGAVLRCAA